MSEDGGAGLLADPAEVRAILVASAQAGLPISYGEVLGLLGHRFTRPKMRALCKVLAFVDDEAAERGEPELAVLVVRQSDGLPGQGWWIEGAKKHGYTALWEGPKAARLIRKLHRQALSFGRTRGLASLEARHLMADTRTFTVAEDDDGIRLDRWFKRHMPEVSFNLVSRWARTGLCASTERRRLRRPHRDGAEDPHASGRRAGRAPQRAQPKREALTKDEEQFVRDMVIYEDRRRSCSTSRRARDPGRDQDYAASLPAARRHWRRARAAQAGAPPRQGHVGRLAGGADGAGGGPFRESLFGADARKVYWALVVGVPYCRRGRDRCAARQAAGDGGGEKMHISEEAGLRLRPLADDRASRQPHRLGRVAAANRSHPPAAVHMAATATDRRRQPNMAGPSVMDRARGQPQLDLLHRRHQASMPSRAGRSMSPPSCRAISRRALRPWGLARWRATICHSKRPQASPEVKQRRRSAAA